MKKQPIVKQTWLERAVDTYNFHCRKSKDSESWKIQDTAKALKRSLGGISEDILIASWVRTHESKIKEFKYAKDALEFIRGRKKRMMTEIEL